MSRLYEKKKHSHPIVNCMKLKTLKDYKLKYYIDSTYSCVSAQITVELFCFKAIFETVTNNRTLAYKIDYSICTVLPLTATFIIRCWQAL